MGISMILIVLLVVGILVFIIGFMNKKETLKKLGVGICILSIIVMLLVIFGRSNM